MHSIVLIIRGVYNYPWVQGESQKLREESEPIKEEMRKKGRERGKGKEDERGGGMGT